MNKPTHSFAQQAPIVLKFSIFYFLLAVTAVYLSRQPGSIATLWFANALGVAYLIGSPRNLTSSLLMAAAGATLLSHLALGDSLAMSLAFVPANVVEIWLAASLVRRTGYAENFHERPENFVRFMVLAIGIPALAGATLGAGALWLGGMQSFPRIWSSWYAGTMIGSTALLPLAVLTMRPVSRGFLQSMDLQKTAMWALISIGVGIFALGRLSYPFIYIMAPLTIAAVLLSFESVSLLVCLSAIVTGGSIATGHFAPLAHGEVPVWQTYFPFLLTMVPPLLMASGMNQSRIREEAHRQAEEALKRSAQDLRTIIDHTPAMIGYWDRDLKNRFGNSAYVEWFGLSQDQMRDRHIREVIGEERYALNLPYIEAALRGESPLFEREIVDQSGHTRNVLASYVPDVVDGEVKGFYAFVNDITSLTLAQRQQNAAQAQLQSIIDAASEFSIIATDVVGTIQVFSPGAERMLGYRSNEIVGLHTPAILHLENEMEERAKELSQELGRRIRNFEIFSVRVKDHRADVHEWTYRRKDGSHLPVRLVVTAMHDAKGTVSGYLGIAKDISRQRELQTSLVKAKDQAEAASRAKSEFVANMSHEIRTPLNAVLGMAHLLGNTSLSPEQRDYLEMVRSSGSSLLGIINDILDFSKIEAGRMDLANEAFELGELLAAVANIMMVNAGEKDLELAIGVGPDVPTHLIGDATRLQQVLINLTGNAIKFTEHGEVTLFVERDDAASTAEGATVLCFRVSDTGIGMNSEQQAKVFSAFSQADSSTTRRFGGTGLGLAICKRLVALMGGEIHVRSAIDVGSEFCLTLPLRITTPQSAPAKASEGGLRLLVIDDNATSRDYLSQTIRAVGWQADCAKSGAEGIGQSITMTESGTPYDMVLLDWHMADLDGHAIMQAIRESSVSSTTPPHVAIMVSAFGRGKLIGDRNAAQADAILVKPVTAFSLQQTLRSTLVARAQGERTTPFEPQRNRWNHRLDGASILLVEDNHLNQVVARGMLTQAGARVDVLDNGLKAVERMAGLTDYDLILMDVQMPVMDGCSAARTIRDELQLSIPILAMTAGVMASEQAQCKASGMNDFISKPIDVEKMFSTIARYLPARAVGVEPPLHVAAPTETASNDSLGETFNPHPVLDLGEGDATYRNQIMDLIRSTVKQSPGQFRDAKNAWLAGKQVEAAAMLHAMRSPLGMLGARQFAKITVEIERTILEGGDGSVPLLFGAAETSLEGTISEARLWLEQQVDEPTLR